MASIKTGFPPPESAICRASLVACLTANISLPSTRMVSMPYPTPRLAMPSPRYCSSVGVEIAYPLLRQMNTTGHDRVAAILSAA